MAIGGAGKRLMRSGASASAVGGLTRRSLGTVAKRAALPLAGRAARGMARLASRAMPYVGAAMTAYDVYKAGKSLFSRGGGKTSLSRRRISGFTSGKYRGKFVRRRQLKRPKKDLFRHHGFVNVSETTGIVKDPDCVYVGHSALTAKGTIEMIAYCMIRKLFALANVRIRNLKDPIPTFIGGGTQWRLRCERRYKDTGVISNEDYTIPDNTSIYQIVGCEQDGVVPLWLNILLNIGFQAGYSSQDDDINTLQFEKLILYRQEGNAGTFWQFEAQMIMDEVWIRFFATSDMKIQNRTLSASGSADAENVGNSPLVGRVYHFNGGSPVAKADNVAALEVVYDDGGVIDVRAAELGDTAFREPASPQNFSNCVGTGKIRLDPGDIKEDRVKVSYKERLFTFLRRLNPRRSSRKAVNKLRGKSALYALEDVINVNGSSLIEVAYEINRTVGCYLSIDPNCSSVGKFSTNNRNNVPPA